MSTCGVPSPTAIHFTIDGRHAMDPYGFRWSLVSRGTWSTFYPWGPLRLDPFTKGASTWDAPRRCGATPNLFSYNIWYKDDELFWTLYSIYRGLLLWPTPLNHGLLVHFEEKVHKKKLHVEDTILLLFPRLLCGSWNIWAFILSLGSRAVTFVESNSS
ncbi:hypothetical protein AAG906_006864 [Vitis piasezkii]